VTHYLKAVEALKSDADGKAVDHCWVDALVLWREFLGELTVCVTQGSKAAFPLRRQPSDFSGSAEASHGIDPD
jgi:hypothetical protein